MPAISVMGFFCEDIREEKNDVITLIGLMPDNADVVDQHAPQPSEKKFLPKICMFLRINFEPTASITDVSVRLVLPNGLKIPLGSIDAALIDTARERALSKGNPLAGVTLRAIMGALNPGNSSGAMRLEAEISGETYVAAALNINVVSSVPTASAPPSLQ